MKNLLYKEFRLSVQLPALFLVLLAGLLLIPEYPYFIPFMYVFITIPILFVSCKEYKDIYFTALLPVRKQDIVRARFMTVMAIEVLQLIISVPVALLNRMLYPQGNPALMDLNMALFGFVFIIYAIFNLIFLPGFYKTANKLVLPVILSVTAAVIFGAAVEFLVQFVPVFQLYFDTPGRPLSQSLTLLVGITIFILLNALAYRRSARYFSKVDV